VQLRYSFRIDPTPGQRIALAQAFGCARVVFNDALALRNHAHRQGLPFITDAELSRLVITQAKQTPQRCWLGEVSAVVLQQALADACAAFRNFFASLTGRRQGPNSGRPGSGPARMPGRRFASPRTPASPSQRAGNCACRR
jgi:putative transposase